LIWESRELTIPVGRAVTANPDGRPGMEERPALISLSTLFTTPVGSAVIGKLTPVGRPDCRAPGRDEMPALMSLRTLLITPNGKLETTGKPDGRPALMPLSRLLMMPVGRAVTGRLAPPGRPERPDWIAPGIELAPALRSDIREFTTPDGKLDKADKPDGRMTDGTMPGTDVTTPLMPLSTLLITPDGRPVTGRTD
jgi:hypothetical protein